MMHLALPAYRVVAKFLINAGRNFPAVRLHCCFSDRPTDIILL
jgi:hypothetical protein